MFVVQMVNLIYPGRSGVVEETKGISTPTEKLGDLLSRNIHGKPEAVLLSH